MKYKIWVQGFTDEEKSDIIKKIRKIWSTNAIKGSLDCINAFYIEGVHLYIGSSAAYGGLRLNFLKEDNEEITVSELTRLYEDVKPKFPKCGYYRLGTLEDFLEVVEILEDRGFKDYETSTGHEYLCFFDGTMWFSDGDSEIPKFTLEDLRRFNDEN